MDEGRGIYSVAMFHGVGAKSAPLKIRQLKMSCRIFCLRPLAPPFQLRPALRPAALGSQFGGF